MAMKSREVCRITVITKRARLWDTRQAMIEGLLGYMDEPRIDSPRQFGSDLAR